MKSQLRVVTFFALLICAGRLAGGDGEPLANIPAGQREALRSRLGEYVSAYGGRKWEKVYGLVSDTGKGGADQRTFVAAMAAEHGTDFAQMPDILEFKPDRTEKGDNGFDIYGCGKARREGMRFNGIVVMHVVFEHNDWFFSGWMFTEFPNEPCKSLADPKWQPQNRMKWNQPMDEVAHFTSHGAPFHTDSPR